MMRDGLKILIFTVFISSGSFGAKISELGPGHRYIDVYLETSLNQAAAFLNWNTFGKEYETLLKFFQRRQERIQDHETLVRIIYENVQEVFLHDYKRYSEFSEIFTSRTFDCATATGLYVSILSDLEIDFQIWETNYHTYLKIPSEGAGFILIETTDPYDGLVTGADAVERENEFLDDNKEGFLYENGLNIHRSISPQEFAGLLYFNQAVKSFNRENYLDALVLIQSAEMYYPSRRVTLLRSLIIEKVSLVATSSL